MAQVDCCVTRNTVHRRHDPSTFEFRDGQAYVLDYEDYH
jgi:hypothetical protein